MQEKKRKETIMSGTDPSTKYEILTENSHY
jgi:hypothetical protein